MSRETRRLELCKVARTSEGFAMIAALYLQYNEAGTVSDHRLAGMINAILDREFPIPPPRAARSFQDDSRQKHPPAWLA